MDEQQVQLANERRGNLEATDDSHSMQSLLSEGPTLDQPKRGEIRTGTIACISPHEIMVDIGYKSEGIIAGRELEGIPAEALAELKTGDEIMVYIVTPEDKNGNIILSLSRAMAEKDWHDAEALHTTQDVFEGIVAGFNKGGLIVKVGKVRGFVPASQLVSARTRQGLGLEDEPEEVVEPEDDKSGAQPQERWQQLVGKKLHLKVIEIDRARNRLILSERAAMRDWRKAQKEKLLSELHEGMQLKGTVISLADFGAFIDLGGADGLVHLSELSWKRVSHPRELLQVGQEVDVEVLSVDRERKRIALSLKRTEADPWSVIEQRYKIGQLVEGTITKLVKFGAFARIKDDDEIEGLIHISELSEGRINHPKEVVHEGQILTLRIIKIEPERRRLGLSLKRVDLAEYAEEDWRLTLADSMQDEPAPPAEPLPPVEPTPPVETIELTPPAEILPPGEPAPSVEELQAPAETNEVQPQTI